MTAREAAVLRDLVARARLQPKQPTLARATPRNKTGAIRYATREEAVEARRRSWRDSKRRHARTVLAIRPCDACGAAYLPNKYAVAHQRFCSAACRSAA